MRYLLIAILAFFISCNPFGGATKSIMVDVVDISAKIQHQSKYTVPRVFLGNFLAEIDHWAHVFKTENGYALIVKYLKVKRDKNGNIDIYMVAKPISDLGTNGYWLNFPITDNDWEEYKKYVPIEIKTDKIIYIRID